MVYEFDRRKSLSNKKKHGIDFVQAQAFWEDPDRLVISARTEDEPRFIIIGRIGEIAGSGIFTPGGDKIRIISVRRSRKEEVEINESEGFG